MGRLKYIMMLRTLIYFMIVIDIINGMKSTSSNTILLHKKKDKSFGTSGSSVMLMHSYEDHKITMKSKKIPEESSYGNANVEYNQKKKYQHQEHNVYGGNLRGQRQRYNKHATRYLNDQAPELTTNSGLFPPGFNIAPKAKIIANATCGEDGIQEFCKMTDSTNRGRISMESCGKCDSYSSDPERRHLITSVLDGSDQWWQSPSVYYGKKYERVTIDLDLGQVYQINFIHIKLANTPKPASWVLERSLDGENYMAWQYFGLNEMDCQSRYRMPAHNGKYNFKYDQEVICSTQFSKPTPLENGEMHVSLLLGRPGLNDNSKELVEFTLAHHIRIRFEGMHTVSQENNNLRSSIGSHSDDKKHFYSMRLIRIIGKCYCSGHAERCKYTNKIDDDKKSECKCLHNTCGRNCEKCCALFNQREYKTRIGNDDPFECEECNCHGHSKECRYSEDVDKRGLSLNKYGEYRGGGVCIDCQKFTTGINCEQCIENYYRPYEEPPDAETPCIPCNCNPIGTDGPCSNYGGECKCKDGFMGPTCSVCTPGYKGEMCSRCDCDVRGTMPGGECESHCQCKLHVEGSYCNKCTKGYFGLHTENAEGCLRCFCSGVTTVCKSSNVDFQSYETTNDWLVTELTMTKFAYPARDNKTGRIVYVMDELQNVESVYWMAPPLYTGNKLISYGSSMVVKLRWEVVRGDTSGRPTAGPDIIIIGANGMRIAYGDKFYKPKNTTISIKLIEDGWYHLPKTIKDIVTKQPRIEYRGDLVTRFQFMSILSDIKSILIRGTFHIDQVDSTLEMVALHVGGGGNDVHNAGISGVEECACPEGYSGLSCEKCAFGYIKVVTNSTLHEQISKCMPCNCNGHAESCDLETEKCSECLHNTYGERCERCAVGFYGNAILGTEVDCLPCACPLLENSNNFSPSCQLKSLSLHPIHHMNSVNVLNGSSEYVCTQCSIGHVGDRCEMCDDGYWGSPTEVGSICRPCACNGGPCDPITGKCIKCMENTEGWRCDRCKSGYYGNPEIGCQQCHCHRNGSMSETCDSVTGQCICNAKFTGRRCDNCKDGFTNIALNCIPCECNLNGTIVGEPCDSNTAQCKCKPGVEGLMCDACMNGYYLFSDSGCTVCQCDRHGSKHLRCNPYTGDCVCKPNVKGKFCNSCVPGYWDLRSKDGCRNCNCDPNGSHHEQCNEFNGKCICHEGVGGDLCNECLEGYYGFTKKGCKKCDACSSPAFVCDADTGRCKCPPKSDGPDCKQCKPNTWDWKYHKGCQDCDCNTMGSVGQSCDLETGQCKCREGFSGQKCDKCAHGYFGTVPNCKPCNCDIRGTRSQNGVVESCNENGFCACKSNVRGRKCETCLATTFDLNVNNPEGCIPCFCFNRSDKCRSSEMSWGQVRITQSLRFNINQTNKDIGARFDHEYTIVKPEMENTAITSLAWTNLALLPHSHEDVELKTHKTFHPPLYYELPNKFLGDRISSYGGFLNFSIIFEGCDRRISWPGKSPLVQIHTHKNFTLDFFEENISEPTSNFSVRLHENHWRYNRNNQNITRRNLMTALQNVTHILLRTFEAFTCSESFKIRLERISFDYGIDLSSTENNHDVATQIEVCECEEKPSAKYTGTSCQDPGAGHYRFKNETGDDIFRYEDFIGISVKCDCNGRSDDCDRETGVCLNCRDNTGGPNCDECAEGWFGNPTYGKCEPCPCPETQKIFSKGCIASGNEVRCLCKQGYTGDKCEYCMAGYYGNPDKKDGKCTDCQCNPNGRLSEFCDQISGQCDCKEGVTGMKCDQCVAKKHVLDEHGCTQCDSCTLQLLDRIESFEELLVKNSGTLNMTELEAPYQELADLKHYMEKLEKQYKELLKLNNEINGVDDTKFNDLEIKVNEYRKIMKRAIQKDLEKLRLELKRMNMFGDTAQNDASLLIKLIKETISELNAYKNHMSHVNSKIALDETNAIYDKMKNKMITMESLKDKVKESENCSEHIKSKTGKYNETLLQLNVDYLHIQSEIAHFESILEDINQILSKVMNLTDTSNNIMETNGDNFKILLKKYNKTEQLHSEIRRGLDDINFANTSNMIETLDDNIKAKQKIIEQIELMNETLGETLLENFEDLDNIRYQTLVEVENHREQLIADEYEMEELINKTANHFKDAIDASKAHQTIINAIKEAKDAAKNATKTSKHAEAQLIIEGESVQNISKDSLEESRNIKAQAEYESGVLKGLKKQLFNQQLNVDNIRKTVTNTGHKNNEIIQMMNTVDRETIDNDLNGVIESAEAITDRMRNFSKQIESNDEAKKLREKLRNLALDWDSKTSLAEENVTKVLRNVTDSEGHLARLNKMLEHNQERLNNSKIPAKIQELRNKIAKAQHAAEGLRVSLTSGMFEPCVRNYLSNDLGKKVSNEIETLIAANGSIQNSPIVFIEGDNNTFIALEMIERQVKLIWNLGSKTQSITYPTKIESVNLTEHRAWYFVKATRVMNIATLVVKQILQGGELENATKINESSDMNHNLFPQTTINRIWLGGRPENLSPEHFHSRQGLGITVNWLNIDKKPIGMWNYENSTGKCVGALEGPQIKTSSPSGVRHFNGKGYSNVTIDLNGKLYKIEQFYIDIEFKTLDENALLILGVDEINNRSISLTLHNGYVVFRVDYSNGFNLELITKNKYNSNKWVNVKVARAFYGRTESGELQVSGEIIRGSPVPPIIYDQQPDLSSGIYYIGGVPPGFMSGSTKAPGAEFPFLGCTKDIQINSESIDPLLGLYHFGIEAGCNDRIVDASFSGKGFIELNSYSFHKSGNLVFTFQTNDNESIILMAAVPPTSKKDSFDDGKEQPGFYSVALLDGRINLRMGAGNEIVKIETKEKFNDGKIHVLSVLKKRGHITLGIDDVIKYKVNEPITSHGFQITLADGDGGLFLGGFPDEPEYLKNVPTSKKFNGVIGNLIFNGEAIYLENHLNFNNVQMGRSTTSADSILNLKNLRDNFKPNQEGCQKVRSYSYEPNAFKFGDGNHSYSIVNLPEANFWQKPFLIEFDFRTYYPDGVIFVTPGSSSKSKQFIYFILKDGHLVLSFRNKRKSILKEVTNLNDGQWHHVKLSGGINNFISMNVDNLKGKQFTSHLKIPKKIQLGNTLAMGGIPENRSGGHSKQLMKLELIEFRGCVKRLKINNVTQDLAPPDLHRNIGQCFPRIEKGSYFPGDAYAIYNKEFDIGNHFEFKLEFKTSELNGILLTIADGLGSPAFSVELFNGNILMSCNLGNDNPFSVQTNLSKYSLCDNQWHTVNGFYDLGQIGLKIDSGQHLGETIPPPIPYIKQTQSPLFIGGLPDNVTGHSILRSRENFKGCIKNIEIGQSIKDWTDMYELHNVLLSECLANK